MTDAPRVPSATRDERLQELTDVVVAIASFHFERRAQIGDGSDVLDGLAVGINMLAEEIGARVAREQLYQRHLAQNERLIAVGQLAAGIAHEVNNPAAYVMANLQMTDELCTQLLEQTARGELDPQALRSFAEQAQRLTRDNLDGLQRIVAIVRDLRQFTRSSDDITEAVALDRVLQDASALVRSAMMFRARLELDVPTGLCVAGDPTKLTQVFTNLLLNAAQAIAEDAQAPQQVIARARADETTVHIDVQDTGSGIPLEVQRRLFEPFFTTKSRDRGTGLGLVIAAEIVRAHGGELRLVETSSAGTTFSVRLPLLRTPHPARARSAPASPLPPRSSTRRLRILLIDDEPQLLAAYRRLLAADYEVEVAVNGRDAVDRLQHDQAWDAILCDVMMPEADGTEVHAWIVRHAPALESRVIFCTGGAFSPRGVLLTERHAARVLQKPFSTAALHEAIALVANGQAATPPV